jgi:hypothetical protein
MYWELKILFGSAEKNYKKSVQLYENVVPISTNDCPYHPSGSRWRNLREWPYCFFPHIGAVKMIICEARTYEATLQGKSYQIISLSFNFNGEIDWVLVIILNKEGSLYFIPWISMGLIICSLVFRKKIWILIWFKHWLV